MEQNWSPFDPGTFENAAEEAEKVFANVAYGKLGLATRYLKFNGKGVKPDEVDAATFQKLDARSRGVEMQFSVDASEFNPSSQFTYTRKVSMSSKDWRKTVAPSILEVFGDYKNVHPGVYVEIADVPQADDPKYNVPKFVRKFPGVLECAQAWKEKFGQNGSSNGNGHSTVSPSGIPSNVIAQAQQLYKLLNSDDTFRAVAGKDPTYASSPVDELLTLAKSA